MSSRVRSLVIALTVIFVLLAVAAVLDFFAFGGIWSGLGYALWSWQYQALMSFWAPLVLALLAALVLAGFLVRSRAIRRQGGYPERDRADHLEAVGWLWALGISLLATLAFTVFLYLQDGSRKIALLKQAQVEAIASPIPLADKRRLPMIVAKQALDLRYARPNYRLTDLHLTRSCSGEWSWTMIQTPKRNWARKTGGVVAISAQQGRGDQIQTANASFKYGPGLHVRDGLIFRLRRKLGLGVSSPETIGAIDCQGKPVLISPIMKWKRAGTTRFSYQAGVALTYPSGKIDYFTLPQAARNPFLARSARIISPQQALSVSESYRYLRGRQNQSRGILGFIAKGDQKQRLDVMNTGDQNPQPYLLQSKNGQVYWVTMMRPYRSGRALGGIMYTNSVTGRSFMWRSPQKPVIGPDAVMNFPDIQTPYINTAKLRGTEPRLFLDQTGKLRYVVSLTTPDRRRVVAAVAVDSLTGEPTALFHYQRDPKAEEKLTRFIETGQVPPDTSLQAEEITPSGSGEKTGGLSTRPLSPAQMQLLLEACRKDPACKKSLF